MTIEETLVRAEQLTFDEYQTRAQSTAVYDRQAATIYSLLGHSGESGELAEKLLNILFSEGVANSKLEAEIISCLREFVQAAKRCEKLKKAIRDSDFYKDDLPGLAKLVQERITQDNIGSVTGEAADCLWYSAAICRDLGVKMADIANANLDKLASRKARGVLQGSGDNR